MKLLIVRMSSLGDLVLSTAFLENLPEGTVVDWVVASEFAFVLRGHPKIRKLIEFDKKAGLKGWLSLARELKAQDYDARIDLHSTLRSRIARIYWCASELFSKKIPTYSISKERVRFVAYLTLKSFLPEGFRPTPFWKRFARLAQKVDQNRRVQGTLKPPSYLPVLNYRKLSVSQILESYHLQPQKYYAVMPASRWASKEWSSAKYGELCATLYSTTQATILLLGRETDAACLRLKADLQQRQIPFVSALNENDFAVTALLIQNSISYIGGDTGLAHLAEAVGVPSVVLFGPTRPDLGFGPWSRRSRSIYNSVACSPCSKDGKICYRLTDRYACLKGIEVDRVRGSVP